MITKAISCGMTLCMATATGCSSPAQPPEAPSPIPIEMRFDAIDFEVIEAAALNMEGIVSARITLRLRQSARSRVTIAPAIIRDALAHTQLQHSRTFVCLESAFFRPSSAAVQLLDNQWTVLDIWIGVDEARVEELLQRRNTTTTGQKEWYTMHYLCEYAGSAVGSSTTEGGKSELYPKVLPVHVSAAGTCNVGTSSDTR